MVMKVEKQLIFVPTTHLQIQKSYEDFSKTNTWTSKWSKQDEKDKEKMIESKDQGFRSKTLNIGALAGISNASIVWKYDRDSMR